MNISNVIFERYSWFLRKKTARFRGLFCVASTKRSYSSSLGVDKLSSCFQIL
jgi:hypothetical protein